MEGKSENIPQVPSSFARRHKVARFKHAAAEAAEVFQDIEKIDLDQLREIVSSVEDMTSSIKAASKEITDPTERLIALALAHRAWKIWEGLKAYIQFTEEMKAGLERNEDVSLLHAAREQIAKNTIKNASEIEKAVQVEEVKGKIGKRLGLGGGVAALAALAFTFFGAGHLGSQRGSPEKPDKKPTTEAKKSLPDQKEKKSKISLEEEKENNGAEANSGGGRAENKFSLAPDQKGKKSKPDMGSDGGGPGSFEHNKPIAHVDYYFGSGISDTLWAKNISRALPDGSLEVVNMRVDSVEGSALAKITYIPMDVVSGQKMHLLAPIGYGASKVKVSGGVPFSFDQQSQIITFLGNAGEVQVEYEIQKARITVEDIPGEAKIDKAEKEKQFSYEDRPLVDAQTVSAIETEIEHRLREFTYITSNDVQRFIDSLPGTDANKIDVLKMGDCDVISAWVARKLQETGHRGLVVGGFTATEGNDLTMGHAKPGILMPDGTIHTFESTSYAGTTRVNVKLKPEHSEKLSRVSDDVNKSYKGRSGPFSYYLSSYGHPEEGFNVKDTLDHIVKDPAYSDCEPSMTLEQFLASISNFKYQSGEFFQSLGHEMKRHPWMAGILALELLAIFGMAGAVARSKLLKKIRQARANYRAKGIAQAYDLVKGQSKKPEASAAQVPQQTGGEKREGQKDAAAAEAQKPAKKESAPRKKDYYDQRIELLYKDPKIAKQEGELLPLEEVYGLPTEEKSLYYRILSIALSSPKSWLDFIPFFSDIRDRAHLMRTIDSAEAEGMKANEFITALRDAKVGETTIKKERGTVPAKASEISERGISLVAKKIDVLRRLDPKRKPLFSEMGIVSATEIETESEKGPRQKSNAGDMADSREYVMGDDLRLRDWHGEARRDPSAPPLIRTREAPFKKKASGAPYQIALEVSGATDEDMAKLAALLMLAREDSDVMILQRVAFTIHGQVIEGETLEGPLLDAFLRSRGNIRAEVETIIKKALNLKVERALDLFSGRMDDPNKLARMSALNAAFNAKEMPFRAGRGDRIALGYDSFRNDEGKIMNFPSAGLGQKKQFDFQPKIA